MTRQMLLFWGSALGVAIGFALLAPLLVPFRRLGLETLADRQRVWLVTLWCGGVLAVLFGASSLLGTFGGIGARDVLESGSVHLAVEERHRSRRQWGAEPFHRSFGWWSVSVGLLLLVFYFIAWLVLGRAHTVQLLGWG